MTSALAWLRYCADLSRKSCHDKDYVLGCDGFAVRETSGGIKSEGGEGPVRIGGEREGCTRLEQMSLNCQKRVNKGELLL